jgi:glucuronide carrier protein
VETVSLRDTLRMMRHNRPLVLLCAATLVFLSGMFAQQTVAVYYARDVLGNANYYIVLTVVSTVGMILASALVPKAVDVAGKKHAYLVAGVIATASAVRFALAPRSAPAIAFVCYGVLGIGLGAINTLIFALQADTVDYGEWNSGSRAEGSFGLLTTALRHLEVGPAYAVWTGIGATGTAVVGMAFLGESVSTLKLVSIGLVLAGVVGLNLSGVTP